MSHEPVSSSQWVGLRDAVLAGWYNKSSGELVTHFPVGPDDVVLDVGCGEGGTATFCAQQGARLILCDLNRDNIETARSRLSIYPGLRLDTYVTDCDPLPLADGTANRIVCTEVLEHVDDPAALLAEMVRVGKPGALYLITVPGTAQEKVQKQLAHPGYFAKPNHVRIFEPGELAELVTNAGLTIEHSGGYGFFWSVFMAIFWQCNTPLSDQRHPCLDLWAQTWNQVLDGRDGARIQAALDAVLPKSQILVARKPFDITAPGEKRLPTLFECTKHLAEGERCSDRVLEVLDAEMELRLAGAKLTEKPPVPRFSDLRVRREGLPDCWNLGKNVFLGSPDVQIPNLNLGVYGALLPMHGVFVMGSGSKLGYLNFSGNGPFIAVGNGADIRGGAIAGLDDCTVLIGEETTATAWVLIDARNRGIVSIGADGMLAAAVEILTDDTHAIRDVVTGKRINKMGGKVIVGPHVWVGMHAQLMGDSYIGEHSVLGAGCFIRDMTVPPNTISVGRPARVVRTAITWTREDLP